MAKTRLVVANWKMYLEDPEEALSFSRSLKRRMSSIGGVEAAIAPPFSLIPVLAKFFKGSSVRVGAQTLSSFGGGAHTGEVSGTLLKKIGASFAIVGHSERRAMGENDESVREELRQADKAGLRIILCVGEKERDEHGGHFEKITSQLRSALEGFPRTSAPRLIIAYEPVWAIGKTAGDAMKPPQVRETVIYIRKILADILDRAYALRVPILYGGSVEAENARALMLEGECSGFLVGHASAEIDSFTEILKACSTNK